MPMIKHFKTLIYICACLLITSTGFAGSEGTSAASFLNIGMGAGPVAMGGSFCAIADDINAVQWNPSGLIQIREKEIMVSHNEWIEGIKSEFMGYAHPFENWTLGLTLNYLHIGEMIKRDINGNDIGEEFGASGTVISAAAGKKFSERLSLGFGLKLIKEAVEEKSASTFAADAGAMYEYEKFKFGAAVQNVGGAIKLYEEQFSLPLTVRLGAAMNYTEKIILSAEINKPLDGSVAVKTGAQWQALEKISLRAGYKTDSDKNTGPGISVGFGFNIQRAMIDYSFTPFGDLESSHLISLKFHF